MLIVRGDVIILQGRLLGRRRTTAAALQRAFDVWQRLGEFATSLRRGVQRRSLPATLGLRAILLVQLEEALQTGERVELVELTRDTPPQLTQVVELLLADRQLLLVDARLRDLHELEEDASARRKWLLLLLERPLVLGHGVDASVGVARVQVEVATRCHAAATAAAGLVLTVLGTDDVLYLGV